MSDRVVKVVDFGSFTDTHIFVRVFLAYYIVNLVVTM